MNKKLVTMVAVAWSALAGALFAADTSVTIVTRQNVTPFGLTPQVGFVNAQLPSAASSAGAATFDVYIPAGRSLVGSVVTVRDVSGSLKLAGVNVSATTASVGVATVTVSNSIATSGTIATSDTVSGVFLFQ